MSERPPSIDPHATGRPKKPSMLSKAALLGALALSPRSANTAEPIPSSIARTTEIPANTGTGTEGRTREALANIQHRAQGLHQQADTSSQETMEDQGTRYAREAVRTFCDADAQDLGTGEATPAAIANSLYEDMHAYIDSRTITSHPDVPENEAWNRSLAASDELMRQVAEIASTLRQTGKNELADAIIARFSPDDIEHRFFPTITHYDDGITVEIDPNPDVPEETEEADDVALNDDRP